MQKSCVLAIVAALVAMPAAIAGTINVPGDYPTIQLAIDAAVNGDIVKVGNGTFTENINLKGKAITVQGNGRQKSIIDGSKGGPCITIASGETLATVVDGFSIKLGTGKLIGLLRYGGGVYISKASSPTISGDTAIGFNTADVGAGMFIDVGCDPLLQDLLIANNVTKNKGTGAGLYVLGNPTFDNCRIAENTATNGAGGGIYFKSSTSSITGSTIYKNHSFYGGGILVSGGSPTISGNLFEFNEVVKAPINGEGGGIGIVGKGTPFVSGNEFRFNSAHTGAGVYTYDSAPTIVTNLIHDNAAATNGSGAFGYGGGVAMGKTAGSLELNEIYFNSAMLGGGVATRSATTALLLNNVIDHNDAGTSGGVGGGVFSKDSSPAIVASTLAFNSAFNGGGLYVTGTAAPAVDTSIIWGNTATSNISFFDGSTLLVISFSDVEAVPLGGSSLSIDPLFANPGARDFRLSVGSPVVDAGNFFFSGPALDVYGNPRIVNARVDMGASEQ
jgi:parallel beta-helix repeat protein